MARARTSYMAHRNGDLPAPFDPLLDFTPAPHTNPRKNSITFNRQREFVAHLAATGIVAEAARHIGASLEALYKLRHKPGAEGFAAAWDEAVERGLLRIEHGALQRAIEGVERLVVSGGKVLGSYRAHNEGLVMFLLRQRRPERYGHKPGQQQLKPWQRRRTPEEVRASILGKLENIERQRREEAAELAAKEQGGE